MRIPYCTLGRQRFGMMMIQRLFGFFVGFVIVVVVLLLLLLLLPFCLSFAA